MQLKSILALSLAATLSLSMLAGCTKKDADSTSSTNSSSSAPPSSSAPAAAKSGQLKTIHEAVKKEYGEAYSPSMAIDADTLETMYGVKKDLVKEAIAEAPMMNVHVDTFIAIEAVEGKGQEVEDALTAYKDKFIAEKEEFPYLPEHLPKAKNAQVLRIDDYVFYIMLGDMSDMAEGEDIEAKAKSEAQRGVDIIEKTIEK